MQVQLALPGPLFPAHGKDIHSFTTLGSSAGGPVFCICLRSRQNWPQASPIIFKLYLVLGKNLKLIAALALTLHSWEVLGSIESWNQHFQVL